MKESGKNAWRFCGLLICSLAILLAAGCSQSVKIPESQSDTELFEQAKASYEQGEYKNALAYFLYVKENFLRSDYAGMTRFYAGQCYYELKNYDEAIIEYKSFISFFPSDPNAAEAQFKLGASLLQLARGPEVDQSTVEEAFAELKKVEENYPENEEIVQKTEDLLNRVKDKIANYEYLVARFYRKEKRYRASNSRILFLMKKYPDTSLYDDALFMMAKNYLDLDMREKGKDALLDLLENYPGYEEREKARKQLVSLGENYIPQVAEASAPVSEETQTGQEAPQEEPIAKLPKLPNAQDAEPPVLEDALKDIPEGYVVLLRNEQVFINLIREDGIQEGMSLEVVRGTQTVGMLRIIEVQEGFSIGEIESLDKGMTIQEDDAVRVLNEQKK